MLAILLLFCVLTVWGDNSDDRCKNLFVNVNVVFNAEYQQEVDWAIFPNVTDYDDLKSQALSHLSAEEYSLIDGFKWEMIKIVAAFHDGGYIRSAICNQDQYQLFRNAVSMRYGCHGSASVIVYVRRVYEIVNLDPGDTDCEYKPAKLTPDYSCPPYGARFAAEHIGGYSGEWDEED